MQASRLLSFAAALTLVAVTTTALAQNNAGAPATRDVLGGTNRAVYEGSYARNLVLLSTTVGRTDYEGLQVGLNTAKIILGPTSLVCPQSANNCVIEATINVVIADYADGAARTRLCFKLDGKYMQPKTAGCPIVGEARPDALRTTLTATAIQFNVKPGTHEIAPWIEANNSFLVYQTTATYRIFK